MARDRRRGMGLGLMFLAYKLHNIGMSTIPPVTLALLVGQVRGFKFADFRYEL